VVNLSEWLVAELDEAASRLRGQVLDLVPEERRLEHPGGGSSILWGTFHVARHAALALRVLDPDDRATAALFSAIGSSDVVEGGGLQETEEPWAKGLAATEVDAYSAAVLDATRRFLARVSPEELDGHPGVDGALEEAGISRQRFDWLYRMWSNQPAAFFVRWPLLGHLGNHVGEMIATRNRMGLSPF
jgi:hypothetical protein